MSDFYTSASVQGKYILYRGIENGKRIARKVEYAPTFFVPCKTRSDYQTIHGEFVEKIKPGTIPECRDFLKQYEEVENFPIYGNSRFEYAFISDQFPDDIHWDIDRIVIAYLDIEVASQNGFPDPAFADQEVTAITMKVGNTFFSYAVGSFTPARTDISYTKCTSEYELLKQFLNQWTLVYPDIITGWNVAFFDITYLVNRMTKILGEDEVKKLSPWRRVHERKAYVMNREQITYTLVGISVLDYQDLYKKYSNRPQESYRLDHIAFTELGERKLNYSEEYENLQQLYLKDFQMFMEYNIRDVELVERLNDKLRLIELALTLAYDNKVNYDDVFTQVRMWDAIIYNHLKEKNVVIPQNKDSQKLTAYEGAYVKDPILGMHEWVVSFDLNSLYPHLIMQYNISMETLIEPENYYSEMREVGSVNVESLLNQSVNLDFLKSRNATITPNGQFFSTLKRGWLCEIMSDMYEDRSRYKKMATDAKKKLEAVRGSGNAAQIDALEKEVSRYTNLQLAKKVSLNSAYGALGNKFFRFFDTRIAEGITTAGQLSIRWIETRINAWMNMILGTTDDDYVIASDTDSIYLNLAPLVRKVGMDTKDRRTIVRWINKACEEKIQARIDDIYSDLAAYMNAYDQKMIMKREAIADKAIWTAKKRYILNVWDNEGVEYAEPALKILGLEAVKSSTPSACREKIKQAIRIVMTKTESDMIKFIDEFRHQFKTLQLEEISFPRGVNGLTEYADGDNFKKGTPIHVKGALVFNRELKAKKLTKRYEKIKDGEKIKFCYLKEPNPFKNNTIAFLSVVPKEFGVDKYIDYDTQFEKSFIEPLKIILNTIGWKTEHISTLDDLFG
jgi:DNA polymerase elongation subunit (family B)